MRRVLKVAGLPEHFTPHCLRHTYASLMLQQGESLQYVQRQLGHSSITLTVDTYGKWLPMGNKAAVDRLDALPVVASGSKVVANEGGEVAKLWSWREESNLQPAVYKTAALPIELRQPACNFAELSFYPLSAFTSSVPGVFPSRNFPSFFAACIRSLSWM
jgi:integrase-like protein